MGDEDRKKYHVAQANQKEAGGAYMVAPRNGDAAADLYGYKMASSSSLDSVESGASNYAYQAAYAQRGSYNYSQPASRSESPVRTPPGTASPLSATSQLALPEPAHRPSAHIRTASSPLARLSLVRTAGPESASAEELEMSAAEPEPPSPPADRPEPAGSDPEEREGRSKERKRLQKKSR